MAVFSHILVPTDFGEPSEEALAIALGLATELEAKVTVLHSLWPSTYTYSNDPVGRSWPRDELGARANDALEEMVTRAKSRYAAVDGAVVMGEPWEKILAACKAHGADLIIMGTHRRRGLSRALLGSVADKIVRFSPVPVMTVSAPTPAGHQELESRAR